MDETAVQEMLKVRCTLTRARCRLNSLETELRAFVQSERECFILPAKQGRSSQATDRSRASAQESASTAISSRCATG